MEQPKSVFETELFKSVFVIVYSVLWSLMEIEIEGTNGWMYNTPTKCTAFAGFTWEHLYMNLIILITLFAALRPFNFRGIVAYVYYNILWFTLEDVIWFFYNEITYGTAPWQSSNTRWISIALLWVFFVLFLILEQIFRKKECSYYPTTILLIGTNTFITVYAFNTNFGTEWKKDLQSVKPRQTYCD